MASVEASAQAIADALAPSPQAPSARWRWGTVVSVASDGTMNVSIGGSTVAGVRCAQHVMGAQVGDRVRVLYCGTEAMVDAVRASSALMSVPSPSMDADTQAAWLDALGFELTSTSTASSIITAASGYSITAAGFASYGGIATLSLSITTTSALTANTTYTVGTIVSGKRPATAIAMTERVGTNTHGKVEIATNGTVTYRPTQAVSANVACVFHTATYIIG